MKQIIKIDEDDLQEYTLEAVLSKKYNTKIVLRDYTWDEIDILDNDPQGLAKVENLRLKVK
jgi:hypothetical protein